MRINKILFACLVFYIAACTGDDSANNPLIAGDDCLRGTGALTTESRDLGNFTGIQNTIPANVFITQGPLEEVSIEAPSNVLDVIRTSVDNNTLNIRIDQCIENLERVNIYVTIPEISRLVLTGVGNMTTENEIDVDELEVTLTGVGNFNLQGTAVELTIDLLGVGSVDADLLNSDICDVDISGEGNVEVFVNNELDVTITGIGSVFYRGNPTVSSTITGNGSVVDAN